MVINVLEFISLSNSFYTVPVEGINVVCCRSLQQVLLLSHSAHSPWARSPSSLSSPSYYRPNTQKTTSLPLFSLLSSKTRSRPMLPTPYQISLPPCLRHLPHARCSFPIHPGANSRNHRIILDLLSSLTPYMPSIIKSHLSAS